MDVCITGIPIFADTSGLHQANGCEMKGLPVPPAGRKVLLEGSIGMAISPPSDTSPIEAAWCPSRLAPSSGKTCTISVIFQNNGPTTLEHLTQSTLVSCNSTAQPHFLCNTKPAVTRKKHCKKNYCKKYNKRKTPHYNDYGIDKTINSKDFPKVSKS